MPPVLEHPLPPHPLNAPNWRFRGNRFGGLVDCREILYDSMDDRGDPRHYSGRVFLPAPPFRRDPLGVPLVVFVHATAGTTAEMHLYNRGTEAWVGAMAALIHHFAVAMPDLPGHGKDPSLRPHPYFHAKSLAYSVLDMIEPALAALLNTPSLRWDGRLFIAGYSAGGFAAMAAVKELHTNPRYRETPLTAAACMAAPFQLSETVRANLREGAHYPRPDIYASLFRAYHDLYPRAGIFSPEHAHDSHWVHAEFHSPAWPNTEAGRAMRENDLVGGWHPRFPILLAASPQDELVPWKNTQAILASWRQLGCSAPVDLIPLTILGRGLPHHPAGILALHKAFLWFRQHGWERVGRHPFVAISAQNPAHRSV